MEALVAQEEWGDGWAYDGRSNLYASGQLLPGAGDGGALPVRIEGGGGKLGYEVWEVGGRALFGGGGGGMGGGWSKAALLPSCS
jgi:hypothetical protein